MREPLKQILDGHLERGLYSHYGATELARPLSFEIYEEWIREGRHGAMAYLERHAEFKKNPRLQSPRVLSALGFAFPYRPHPEKGDYPFKAARVATYAQGGDYHHWLKEKLTRVADELRAQYPGEVFEVHTDASPLPERALAVNGGLGWIGKNSCVIHPKKGSFFLLGEILTSLTVEAEFAPLPDFCGQCRRCLDACPTSAILENRTLDSRKCISYWTIESREIAPEGLRQGLGDWLFGCDICQSVCPWNQKPFRPAAEEGARVLPAPTPAELVTELKWILDSSGKQIEKALKFTALSRAGGFGLKRNALVVIANRRIQELDADVAVYENHLRLGELARWCRATLRSPSSISE